MALVCTHESTHSYFVSAFFLFSSVPTPTESTAEQTAHTPPHTAQPRSSLVLPVLIRLCLCIRRSLSLWACFLAGAHRCRDASLSAASSAPVRVSFVQLKRHLPHTLCDCGGPSGCTRVSFLCSSPSSHERLHTRTPLSATLCSASVRSPVYSFSFVLLLLFYVILRVCFLSTVSHSVPLIMQSAQLPSRSFFSLLTPSESAPSLHFLESSPRTLSHTLQHNSFTVVSLSLHTHFLHSQYTHAAHPVASVTALPRIERFSIPLSPICTGPFSLPLPPSTLLISSCCFT